MRKTESSLYSFFIKVKITKTCWLWQGAKHEWGYGIMGKGPRGSHKNIKAHKFSWSIFRGEIPPQMCVLHKCDNSSCVNPKHLFLGTLKDNSRDMMKKGRGRGQVKKGQKFPYKPRPSMIGNKNNKYSHDQKSLS